MTYRPKHFLPSDSGFRTRVEAIVKKIPLGTTMSYGQVAAAAGRPGAARAVGAIMASNVDTSVPCHRVIRADGTLGGYNSINGPSKEALLRSEGVLL